MKLSLLLISVSIVTCSSVFAEHLPVDSTNSQKNIPVISGYGEAAFNYHDKEEQAKFNFTRAVFMINYRFNDKIELVSEFELESAGIEAGEETGEFALEQAYLEFKLRKNMSLVAGLFIPRIGITNEYHLPQEHLSVERPIVERIIIPTTWREMGVALRGNFERFGGIEYQLSLMSGLNAEHFEYGTGIRGGRQEGREALGNSLAIHGSLNGYAGPVRLQVSAYLSGSAPFEPEVADQLNLDGGPFGTPVLLAEANAIYENGPWQIRALASMINISNAKEINDAFSANIPEQLWGAYAELAYNFLHKSASKKLQVFSRVEQLNLNAKVPDNGLENKALNQTYFTAGINYEPTSGVCVKADYTLKSTGEYNSELSENPELSNGKYYKQQGTWSIGIGYSF